MYVYTYLSLYVCLSKGVDAGRALQLLTQSGPYALPSLENVVSRATSNLVHRPDEAPISDDQLNSILLVCANILVTIIHHIVGFHQN